MADSGQNSTVADVFAGAGMGALIGVTVGLATTPVVAIVVGALTSLLAVFLGLGGSESSPKLLAQINTTRIGALGFAMVFGLLFGLFVRINNPLAEDPRLAIDRWAAALPDDPTLAKQMMVYERTGIAPLAFTFGKSVPVAPVEAKGQEAMMAPKSAVLFSTMRDFDACSRLNPARYATTADALGVYADAAAPRYFPSIKALIEQQPDPDHGPATALAREIICIIQLGGDP